jgi:hypothetical protein
MRFDESNGTPSRRAFDANPFEALGHDRQKAAWASIFGRLHETYLHNKGENKVQAQISRKKAPAA